MGLIGTVLAGWVLLNGLMFLAQPGMIFFPTQRLDATPRDWGLAHQDVWLKTDDGLRLHGWYIPREGAERTLLFFHGNAGNISHRGESVAIFHRLGLNVLMVDYRGYGRSEGSPSEDGLYRDARAAWQWLTEEQRLEPEQIVVFGRSLGATVAATLAAESTPAAVILESGFSSARDAAQALFPVLSRVVILRYRLDAADALTRATSPVLVLHSPDDEVIPYPLGQRLYDAAPEPKRFVELRGGHNDGFLRSQPEYERTLGAFLATLGAPRGQP
ncbi:MAG: alpha/beta hydrolase [Chromatiaceae bacterium]|jgi:hypothetical protein|nr:alpha/beta hydrolase [Chromatiaceae bacterium]